MYRSTAQPTLKTPQSMYGLHNSVPEMPMITFSGSKAAVKAFFPHQTMLLTWSWTLGFHFHLGRQASLSRNQHAVDTDGKNWCSRRRNYNPVCQEQRRKQCDVVIEPQGEEVGVDGRFNKTSDFNTGDAVCFLPTVKVVYFNCDHHRSRTLTKQSF